MKLSLIVPATNEPPTLPRVLASVEAAAESPEQVIVVRDRTLRHPALARNAGARDATGDVLVFLDGDVTVHADAFTRIRRAFESDPELTALFGSYDDAPDSMAVVSAFRNLLHHHVHQVNAGPAGTFWAGLGAMRRDAFEAMGGFAVHPIEDIDLGMRLKATGAHIVLDPTIQGTHLKHWTLASMIRTDLFVRGIPWVGLLIDHRGSGQSSALNLSWRHRLSALASLILVLSLLFARVWIALGALLVLVALNFDLYRLLARVQGLPSAIVGVGLHVIHHLVSVVAVPLGILAHRKRSRRQPAARPAT